MAKQHRRPRRTRFDDEPSEPPDRAVSRRVSRRAPPPREPQRQSPRPLSLLEVASAQPVALACGRCVEWVADEEGGRGECLHPGSGMLKPWSDTPACPFFH